MRGPPEPLPGLAVRVGAMAWAEQYAAGQASLGFTVDAGLRYRIGSASVEVHGDPPLGPTVTNAGNLSVARVTGAFLPCLLFEWVVLCGKIEAGRLLFPVAPEPLLPTYYRAAGVRVSLNFPAVPPRFKLGLGVEILAPIDPAFIHRGQEGGRHGASGGGARVRGGVDQGVASR
jgi:hypothetical protein